MPKSAKHTVVIGFLIRWQGGNHVKKARGGQKTPIKCKLKQGSKKLRASSNYLIFYIISLFETPELNSKPVLKSFYLIYIIPQLSSQLTAMMTEQKQIMEKLIQQDGSLSSLSVQQQRILIQQTIQMNKQEMMMKYVDNLFIENKESEKLIIEAIHNAQRSASLDTELNVRRFLF